MKKYLFFIVFVFLGVFIFIEPLRQLTTLSFDNELYSHFLLVPVVSIYFLLVDRKRIFEFVFPSPGIGAVLAITGLLCYGVALQGKVSLNTNDFLSLCLVGFVTWIIGCFLGAFGKFAFQKGLFSLLFLVFMIPIPSFLLDPTIRFLQVWSAHATHLVFMLSGIPFLRDGMVFEVPGLAIEVAEQCSGIRSSLALLITSVIAGYMFLNSKKRRALLIIAVIPITVIKNAIRITTLTLLSVYVDMAWMTNSWLHSGGGIVFFAFVLVFLLAPLLWLLRRSEKKKEKSAFLSADIPAQIDH
jgi:exosortase